MAREPGHTGVCMPMRRSRGARLQSDAIRRTYTRCAAIRRNQAHVHEMCCNQARVHEMCFNQARVHEMCGCCGGCTMYSSSRR